MLPADFRFLCVTFAKLSRRELEETLEWRIQLSTEDGFLQMLLCDPVRSVARFYSANRKACFTKLHIMSFLCIMKASPGCYVSMHAKA